MLDARCSERGRRWWWAVELVAAGRVRRAGAGRKPLTETDPKVIEDLERMVDPATRGDPERPLRWTSKSAAKLVVGLRELGPELVERAVLRLLDGIGYTRPANVKAREGADHPDRGSRATARRSEAARR